jgi:hypothetical protein
VSYSNFLPVLHSLHLYIDAGDVKRRLVHVETGGLVATLGVRTLMSVAVIPLHTVLLEHSRVAMYGSYFLLVVPVKLRNVMFSMVSGDGNSVQRVRFFCP